LFWWRLYHILMGYTSLFPASYLKTRGTKKTEARSTLLCSGPTTRLFGGIFAPDVQTSEYRLAQQSLADVKPTLALQSALRQRRLFG
jgi:hypothetical protein